MIDRVLITIDSKYHRGGFDDWLAGGRVEYEGKTYYWAAQDSNYGFGWEIEPLSEEDWCIIAEEEFNKIIDLVESYLYQHRTEYLI